MGNFKSIYFGLLTFILIFVAGPQRDLHAREGGEAKICFRWAFGAMIGAEDDRRFVAITKDIMLKTGDRLKMLVEIKTPCYVYVLYSSGQGEMSLLFPYRLNQFESDYKINREYYIPDGEMWFELDEELGLETFYLLASRQRLSELEELFAKLGKSSGVEKKSLTFQIREEIRKIKKRCRTLATPAERPIPIGGHVRGTTIGKGPGLPDIDAIAEEISTDSLYSKTFTIHHQ